jgi:hypothetical protein
MSKAVVHTSKGNESQILVILSTYETNFVLTTTENSITIQCERFPAGLLWHLMPFGFVEIFSTLALDTSTKKR